MGLLQGTTASTKTGHIDFLVLCMILTVTFFGLIHAAVYFSDLASAAIGSKNSKAMIVLP